MYCVGADGVPVKAIESKQNMEEYYGENYDEFQVNYICLLLGRFW